MHWLTTTHTRRWYLARGISGEGAVYQGRFKAIPVKADNHFLCVCRYVERNALRAGLVTRAEHWRWGSLWRQWQDDDGWLSPWPCPPTADWIEHVNAPQPHEEVTHLRDALARARPFGDEEWVQSTIARLGTGGCRRTTRASSDAR